MKHIILLALLAIIGPQTAAWAQAQVPFGGVIDRFVSHPEVKDSVITMTCSIAGPAGRSGDGAVPGSSDTFYDIRLPRQKRALVETFLEELREARESAYHFAEYIPGAPNNPRAWDLVIKTRNGHPLFRVAFRENEQHHYILALAHEAERNVGMVFNVEWWEDHEHLYCAIWSIQRKDALTPDLIKPLLQNTMTGAQAKARPAWSHGGDDRSFGFLAKFGNLMSMLDKNHDPIYTNTVMASLLKLCRQDGDRLVEPSDRECCIEALRTLSDRLKSGGKTPNNLGAGIAMQCIRALGGEVEAK